MGNIRFTYFSCWFCVLLFLVGCEPGPHGPYFSGVTSNGYGDDYYNVFRGEDNKLYTAYGHLVKSELESDWQVNNDTQYIDKRSFKVTLESVNNPAASFDATSEHTARVVINRKLQSEHSYTEVLPDLSDIDTALALESENRTDTWLWYGAYFDSQYSWDGNSYIGTLDYKNLSDGLEIQAFISLERDKKEAQWQIRLLDIHNASLYYTPLLTRHSSFIGVYDYACDNMYSHKYDHSEVSGNVQDNDLEEKCLFREGEISYQKNPLMQSALSPFFDNELLWKYWNVAGYQTAITIDEQGNMHLFYATDEMVKSRVLDYVMYSYFSKDDPNEPLNTQKVPVF